MALVSGGGRSTLNPDAPLFVPAAYRQVEDFSPEWWQLVTTTTWFRDYWLSQHQNADGFFGNAADIEVDEDDEDEDDNDVADLLPDSFDFYVGEDLSGLKQAQFQEFRGSLGNGLGNGSGPFSPNMLGNGFEMGTGKNTSLLENRKDIDPPGKSLNTK